MSFQVLLFYKYVTIQDPHTFAASFEARARILGLKGRALIAEEGLNATLEGEIHQTEIFAQELLADPRFADMNIKRSVGDGKTFPKLWVRVRQEIVGTKLTPQEADPRVRTSPHLSPEALRAMYERNEDFVVVDMRNSYEFVSGHFKNSIDPGMRASRDLKEAVVKLAPYKDKKIVTVCTGGVRCEKMSAYLLNQGFTDVSQLENGIHAYMEKYPGKDFLGTLYTFDERVMMDFGGEREIVGHCHHCHTQTERYLNCANYECHLHLLVCEACAPTKDQAFCGARCKAEAAWLKTKKRSREVAAIAHKRLRRYKRIIVGRSRTLYWKVRTGKLLAVK